MPLLCPEQLVQVSSCKPARRVLDGMTLSVLMDQSSDNNCHILWVINGSIILMIRSKHHIYCLKLWGSLFYHPANSSLRLFQMCC